MATTISDRDRGGSDVESGTGLKHHATPRCRPRAQTGHPHPRIALRLDRGPAPTKCTSGSGLSLAVPPQPHPPQPQRSPPPPGEARPGLGPGTVLAVLYGLKARQDRESNYWRSAWSPPPPARLGWGESWRMPPVAGQRAEDRPTPTEA